MAVAEPTHGSDGPEMNDDFLGGIRMLLEIGVPKVVGPTVASRFLRMREGELLETA
jgi:hypothetical protein